MRLPSFEKKTFLIETNIKIFIYYDGRTDTANQTNLLKFSNFKVNGVKIGPEIRICQFRF